MQPRVKSVYISVGPQKVVGQKDLEIHAVLLHHQSSIWSSLSKASLFIVGSALVTLLLTMLMVLLAFPLKFSVPLRGLGVSGHAYGVTVS